MEDENKKINSQTSTKIGRLLRHFFSKQKFQQAREFVSHERRRKIKKVLSNRTNNVVPVLEGIYDIGNINAVLRSAESLGLQTCHVIKTANGFGYSKRVTQGAHKWLNVHTWDQSEDCFETLRAQGFQICATHREQSVSIDEIDFTQPTAIVFGNEKAGVSEHTLKYADKRFFIPMLGFTESFNISVAAAIAFYHIYKDRIAKQGFHGDLPASVRYPLETHFYLQSTQYPLRKLQDLEL